MAPRRGACHIRLRRRSSSLIEAMLTRIIVCLFLVLTSGPILFGADLAMKVNDKNYLDTQVSAYFSTTARTIPCP
jgi:hypothetical protein